MTTEQPSESAITLHNRALAFDVLKRLKVHSRYPRVSEQVQCLPLETHKLHTHGYNATINSRGWMVYRFHRGSPATKLAVAQLGKDGTVVSDRELVIGGLSEEDPRLFTFNGEDYLSYVESPYPFEFKSVVKYVKFEGMQVGPVQQTPLGKNDGSAFEKNWQYWSHKERLYVIYECSPTHRVFDITDDKFVEHDSPGVQWPYGNAKGGTVPLPYEGKLLRFFHSRADNEHLAGEWRHRYFVGAYLMEPEPPFKVVRVSKRPIIYGSEIGTVTKKQCPHFKVNVVFPGGAIETQGGHLLALGINDAECVIAKITPEQLNF